MERPARARGDGGEDPARERRGPGRPAELVLDHAQRLALPGRAQDGAHEVRARAEHPLGAHDQVLVGRRAHGFLAAELGAAVHRERSGRRVLGDRAATPGRRTRSRSTGARAARCRGRPARAAPGASAFSRSAASGFGLAAVDRREGGAVQHHVGPVRLERALHRGGVGDVELGVREPDRRDAVRAGERETRRGRAGRPLPSRASAAPGPARSLRGRPGLEAEPAQARLERGGGLAPFGRTRTRSLPALLGIGLAYGSKPCGRSRAIIASACFWSASERTWTTVPLRRGGVRRGRGRRLLLELAHDLVGRLGRRGRGGGRDRAARLGSAGARSWRARAWRAPGLAARGLRGLGRLRRRRGAGFGLRGGGRPGARRTPRAAAPSPPARAGAGAGAGSRSTVSTGPRRRSNRMRGVSDTEPITIPRQPPIATSSAPYR